MLGNFNPRSLVGNDVSVQRNLYRGFNFNPRSLVGNDAALYTLVPYCADFNPRSLVGNDVSPIVFSLPFSISIHVPSWGTTITSP